MEVLQQLHCKSLFLSLFFPHYNFIWIFKKFWFGFERFVFTYNNVSVNHFPKVAGLPFLRPTQTENTPVVSSRPVNEDCRTEAGSSRLWMLIRRAHPPPPTDATDTEDNGCACIVGAFRLWLTETDLAAAFNGVGVACWLYFMAEHRPHRHNKLRQGDLCKSEISSSKANMPAILRQAAPIFQSPGRTSKQFFAWPLL